MQVGQFTYGQENIRLIDFGEGASLSIGKFCSIAAEITVYLGGNHRTDRVTTYPFGHIHQDQFPHSGAGHPVTKGNVVIGNDVWIGRGVTIMSGITIGNGSVIAANSHVIKDVAAYSIVGGNPAKHLKDRFNTLSSLQRRELENIAWWNWPIEKIKANIDHICSTDIIAFIEMHSTHIE